jgi:DtxR family Mn-dependent transcriptional regulator
MTDKENAEERKESERVEEYLEEIRRAEENSEECTTTTLAKKLKITPASVTEMLRKLRRDGYIEYEPYGDVHLTARGRAVGKSVLDRHRVAEEFLRMLGLNEEEIHDEACKLEHALSDKVFLALSEHLKELGGVVPLSALKEGEKGVIVRIDTDLICMGRGHGYGCSENALKRLADLGFTPKTEVEVKRIAPFGGPVEVTLRGTTVCIGRRFAEGILVRRAGSADNVSR